MLRPELMEEKVTEHSLVVDDFHQLIRSALAASLDLLQKSGDSAAVSLIHRRCPPEILWFC